MALFPPRTGKDHAGIPANIQATFDITTTYTREGVDIIPTQKEIISAPTDGSRINVKSFSICMRDLPEGNKGVSVRFASSGTSHTYLTGALSTPLAAGSEFTVPFEVPFSRYGYFSTKRNEALTLSGVADSAVIGTVSPNCTGNIVYSIEQ